MVPFLQIVGTAVLALASVILLLLLAAAAYFFLPWRRVRKTRTLSYVAPMRIRLNVDPMPRWPDRHVEQLSTELETLGFEEAQYYDVFEMEALKCKTFVKAPFYAVLYHHAAAGEWIEMIGRTPDGKTHVITGTPMGHLCLENGTVSLQVNPTDIPTHLFKRLSAVSEQWVDLTQNDLRTEIETTYAEVAALRAKHGGIRIEEVRYTAMAQGRKLDDAALEAAFIDAKEQELHQWHAMAIDAFKPEQENPCEVEGYGYVIVPSIAYAPAFVRYLQHMGLLSEPLSAKYAKLYAHRHDVAAIFDTINDGFSEQVRAERRGDVDHPFAMTLYKLPEHR